MMDFKPNKYYLQTEGTVKRIVFFCASVYHHPVTDKMVWYGFSYSVVEKSVIDPCLIVQGSSSHLRNWAEVKWNEAEKTWEKK